MVFLDARSAAPHGDFCYGKSHQYLIVAPHLTRWRVRVECHPRSAGVFDSTFPLRHPAPRKVQGIPSSLRAPRCARGPGLAFPGEPVRRLRRLTPVCPLVALRLAPVLRKNRAPPGRRPHDIPCGPDPRRPAVLGCDSRGDTQPNP